MEGTRILVVRLALPALLAGSGALSAQPGVPEGTCVLHEAQKLIASDASESDQLGSSVSISGNYAVVGGWRANTAAGESGAAYVFRREETVDPLGQTKRQWVEAGKLVPENIASGDFFGWTVSISGDYAIVGARFHPTSTRAGTAYIFRRHDPGTPSNPSDDTWVEADELAASDAAAGDEFGFSVAIDGDRCIIGAWHDEDAGTDSGSAYIFRRDDNGTPANLTDDRWLEEAKLVPLDGDLFDNFAVAVSISGPYAIVGSWMEDEAANLAGSAYVFRLDGNGTADPRDDFWLQDQKLFASDAAAGDELGKSVSISGDLAAAGAFEDDDACLQNPDPHCDSGAAYVFRRDDRGTADPSDDEWVEVAKFTASDSAPQDFFGRVGVDGRYLITGSLDDEGGTDAGSAYIFRVDGTCTDLTDFAQLQICANGGSSSLPPQCEPYNFDGDNDVDLGDHRQFLTTFTGP